MPRYLVEYLIENYPGNGIFILNDNSVKKGLKEVLISGMKVVKIDFKSTEASHPTFKDRYFLRN